MASADHAPPSAESSAWSIPLGLFLLLGGGAGFGGDVRAASSVLELILIYAGARFATLMASYAPSSNQIEADVSNFLGRHQ